MGCAAAEGRRFPGPTLQEATAPLRWPHPGPAGAPDFRAVTHSGASRAALGCPAQENQAGQGQEAASAHTMGDDKPFHVVSPFHDYKIRARWRPAAKQTRGIPTSPVVLLRNNCQHLNISLTYCTHFNLVHAQTYTLPKPI